MERTELLSTIVDISDNSGAKIDGDFIVLEESNVNSFINGLDYAFSQWTTKEQSKDGKI